MFIDASAMVAVLAEEREAGVIKQKVKSAAYRTTSPLAVWEATLAFARLQKIEPGSALQAIEEYLALADIEVRDIPAAARFAAVDAFARYGKGRHPAALNFGDCFAYACAKTGAAPLLFKGDDFAQTDIARA